jgi:hypothetical protein
MDKCDVVDIQESGVHTDNVPPIPKASGNQVVTYKTCRAGN